MIDRQRLVSTFLDLIRIDNPSGQEQQVAAYCSRYLARLGAQPMADAAGNLYANFAGQGQPLLLNSHMDSVQPCLGIKPIVEGDTIRSDGTTILGADDRAGLAAILEVLQVLHDRQPAHPPLEVLFTVREESGLAGSKLVEFSRLTARVGIALDHHGPAGGLVIAAPYQNRVLVAVHGRAAHAGAEPEKGISAIRVAAEAIAAMPLGRIDPETTANIGIIHGGTARNAVPARVDIEGEARSRNEAKLEAQTAAMVRCFEEAAARNGARADVQLTRNYNGFRAGPDSPALQRLMAACRAVGIEPRLEESGGGSDVNIFRTHGIDAITTSVGYDEVHTVAEHQSITELVKSTEILLQAVLH